MADNHYQKYGRKHYLANKEKHHHRARKWLEKHREYSLFRNCRYRAKKDNLEFNLDPMDIIIPDVCPILQTPFKYNSMSAPSVDRIDNSKGYTKDNIQVISRRANTMKGDCTPDQLKQFAKWILEKYK